MLLFLLCWLPLASAFGVTNLHAHHAETLKVKCDALPYRTFFDDGRCYFAIGKQQSHERATEECPEILPGSKLISPPKAVARLLFLEPSDFHRPTEAGQQKKLALCLYESPMECASVDQPHLPGGKCAIRSEKKMTYPDAVQFCASQSAVLPIITISKEQRSIYGLLRSDPAWIGVTVNQKWSGAHRYTWLTACNAAKSTPAKSYCNAAFAIVVMPPGNNQAYSAIKAQMSTMGVICVRDAASAFWTVPKTIVPTVPPKSCEDDHEYDPMTNECEWTGPENACLKLIHLDKRTWYMNNTSSEEKKIDLARTQSPFNDYTVQVVVRRGCRVSMEAHPPGYGPFVIILNKPYGKHNVPCYYTNTASTNGDGVSVVACFCDNPGKKIEPKKILCEEDHRYDPATGLCEWTGPENACLKLIHLDKRTWYMNNTSSEEKKIDLARSLSPFNDYTVQVVVRRGCRVSMEAHPPGYGPLEIILNKPYGKHNVPCYYSNTAARNGDGVSVVACFCDSPGKKIEP